MSYSSLWFSAYNLIGQQITVGEPSVFCLMAQTPEYSFVLDNNFVQYEPKKGQRLLAAAFIDVNVASVAAYPKNSEIYPAIILIFF